MAIAEAQLETWSKQGTVPQSSTTYNSIKNVLEAEGTPYFGKKYEVFLQGSYGNSTNIYSESDVDIVIKLNDCFHRDITRLPAEQQSAYKSMHNDAAYTHVHFKADVLKVLTAQYGANVDPGDKAIAIAAGGNRRKADVISAINFRRYKKFLSFSDQEYIEGISFYTSSGTHIVNYPKQHSANLTQKHQNTDQWFKPTARILKNLRSRLVSEGMLEAGVAPSYYLEGLLYNVPDDKFGRNYAETFASAINWILESDRSKLVCANYQYFLLHPELPVTWREDKLDAFLAAAVDLWNQW